ncbi:MAG: SHOCT domain-containing protein [Proteobacteria bacterium]|nr:SHOCT domain-containing protein [Pseudomonadota bacterium]NOG60870.1 SHOCT domain-containing protein [Pseudomonadota bacterium]
MKVQKFNLLIYILFLSLLTINSAIAASYFEDEDVIWQSGYNLFKFDDKDRKNAIQNDHPVNLNEKEIAIALESLRIIEKKLFGSDDEPESVFSISTSRKLAKFIVEGLKQAKPNQDIVFMVQSLKPKLVFLEQKYMTSGRVFIKDNKLNLIIGDFEYPINDAFESAINPSGQGTSTLTTLGLKHGSRSENSNGFKETLITSAGIDNKRSKNELRNDWLVIDTKIAADTYLAEIEKLKNPKTQTDKKLEAEAAKLAKQRREMRAEMARMRKEVQDATSNKSSSAKSIEERMATLDQLLDKKLITQEEYDSKRKEILSDI